MDVALKLRQSEKLRINKLTCKILYLSENMFFNPYLLQTMVNSNVVKTAGKVIL